MRSILRGRRVLITGAARGLGAQTAMQLAERGALVSLVGLEPDLLEQVRREIGSRHIAVVADVTNQAELENAFARTTAEFGGIDAVVANAGISNTSPLSVGSADAHVRTIDVNLGGAVRTASCAFPHLKASGGYLVFIASVGSFSVMPGMATYCASKAGVESLAAGLRMEWRHHGIRVGSVHPTFVDTDLVRQAETDTPTFERLRASLPGALGSTMETADVAEVIVRAVKYRRRRAYAPGSLAALSAGRSLMLSAVGERLLERRLDLRNSIPMWESEALSTGRDFGRHTADSAVSE